MKRQDHTNLDTPCLVLDLDRLDANIRLVHGAAGKAGKRVRPHAKTHKCSEIAKRQIRAGALGVCAAKVSEAEALVAAGVRGILVTGPVATAEKAERLAGLLGKDPGLMAVVDQPGSARILSRAVTARKRRMGILVDVDAGLGRTGVAPRDALDLALFTNGLPGLEVRGIQAYAGQVQHMASRAERRRTSLARMREAAAAFRAMQAAGLPVRVFSGAGTGTYDIDVEIPELTELQVGSYVLMDAEYADVGATGRRHLGDVLKPALTLLTTVVSANQTGYVTVDAGLKSLYRHGGIPRVLAPRRGRGHRYEWFGDEYGKVFYEGGRRPETGTVFELMVSHCDPTVNLFDRYHVVRKGRVVDVWPIDLRGRSQ